jgi:hypothetical protein
MRLTEFSVNLSNRVDIVTRPWDGRSGVRASAGERNFFVLQRDLTSTEFDKSDN